jgi:CBS domain-containing membrane protein
VAVAVGLAGLAAFGLLEEPSDLSTEISLAHVGPAALSLAATEAILILLEAGHPPAGASVLIVSMGLLTKPHDLLAMVAGIVLVTVVGRCSTAHSGCRCRCGRLARPDNSNLDYYRCPTRR